MKHLFKFNSKYTSTSAMDILLISLMLIPLNVKSNLLTSFMSQLSQSSQKMTFQ